LSDLWAVRLMAEPIRPCAAGCGLRSSDMGISAPTRKGRPRLQI